MILAAGRGERMRPLTDALPKPLLRVGGKPLIQYHVEGLVAAGVRELVVNVSWLGEQVEAFLGDGSDFGCSIRWSREPEALETAGGIVQALPWLGDEPFVVVNGDVWTDYAFPALCNRRLPEDVTAHLVMVDNPGHHAGGDFMLREHGSLALVDSPAANSLTYAGIALFRPAFFAGCPPGRLPLRPLLDEAIPAGRVSGERHGGRWCDVGTPERLQALEADLSQ